MNIRHVFRKMLLKVTKKSSADAIHNRYIKRFNSNAFTEGQCTEYGQFEASITKLYHSVEKGLSYKEYKAGFGKQNIEKLILSMRQYADKYDVNAFFYQTALSVLWHYIDKNREYGLIDEELEKTVRSLSGEPNDKGGVITVSAPGTTVRTLGYKDFVESRHSIRQFSNEPVNVEVIRQAIELAQFTPSACNRQGWKCKVVSDKELIKKLLAKSVIGDRIEKTCAENNVEVDYAYQSLSSIPELNETTKERIKDRTKPWGTGQAVLAAKDMISTPFAVINADDYYGKEAYRSMHEWLCESHEPTAYAMAGFILKNTLSDNGGVTRGVCKVEDGHTHVTDVVETKNIVKVNGGAEADGKSLDPESFVSMNFWGFPGNPPEFLKVLEEGFVEFFESEVPTNPMKAEYLLPTIIGGMLREGTCTVRALPTNDTWYGMTYKEDAAAVQEAFAELLKAGNYKEDLFSDL